MFLDTSVIAHAAGNIGYAWAVTVLQRGMSRSVLFVTDALSILELEEALTAIQDARRGALAARVFQAAVSEVVSVTVQDLSAAREIARLTPALSPRECVRVAIMQRKNIDSICAVLETGYANVEGLRHLTLPPPEGGVPGSGAS